MALKSRSLRELLCQALETERGGAQIYETALQCVRNGDLREEWEKYLEQTRRHAQALGEVFAAFGLDSETETPGRAVVRHQGESLVRAMRMALDSGDRRAAQLTAGECVVLAETKDHMNWHLLGECVKRLTGARKAALKKAHDEVEDQEDEHLYHSRGWVRELWMESLGMEAVLPPPEEEKDVKTAIGAARAEQGRTRRKPRKHPSGGRPKKAAGARSNGRKAKSGA